jgi:hypothetical protein
MAQPRRTAPSGLLPLTAEWLFKPSHSRAFVASTSATILALRGDPKAFAWRLKREAGDAAPVGAVIPALPPQR